MSDIGISCMMSLQLKPLPVGGTGGVRSSCPQHATPHQIESPARARGSYICASFLGRYCGRHALGALTLPLVFVVAGLCGCAHTYTRFSESREAATGIESGERIAIILGAGNTSAPSESDEKDIESCLAEAMRAEEPKLAIVPSEEFRRAAFPGISFQDSPRNIEALLPLLTDAEQRERMASLKLRYLVILRTFTDITTTTPLGGDYAFGIGVIGRTGIKDSQVTAEILDLKEARQSGKLIAHASGKTGFGALVLLIVPIPTNYYYAPTEWKACDSLGRATARFIMEKGCNKACSPTSPRAAPNRHSGRAAA